MNKASVGLLALLAAKPLTKLILVIVIAFAIAAYAMKTTIGSMVPNAGMVLLAVFMLAFVGFAMRRPA